VLEVEPHRVARMVPVWEQKYRTQTVPNTRWNTVGLLVPIDEFKRIAVEHVSYTILADFRSRGRLGLRSA
jgi:hypothetical protein